MIDFSSIPNRIVLARLYYGTVLVYLLYHLYSHVLLSQLQEPVISYAGTDFTYIALLFTGVSKWLVQHQLAAVIFDVSLFAVTILCFIYPSRWYLPLLFTFMLGIYEVSWYTFLCFHKHNLTGVWWCSLMFCIINDTGFVPLFYLTRYYCLFIYASSGFWKFYRGVWDFHGHLSSIIKADALAYMVENPQGFHSTVIAALNTRQAFIDQLMLLTCFAQIAFIAGFFTRRFDWFLFAFAFCFQLLVYFLLQDNFIEMSVILITLLPVSWLYKRPAST